MYSTKAQHGKGTKGKTIYVVAYITPEGVWRTSVVQHHGKTEQVIAKIARQLGNRNCQLMMIFRVEGGRSVQQIMRMEHIPERKYKYTLLYAFRDSEREPEAIRLSRRFGGGER